MVRIKDTYMSNLQNILDVLPKIIGDGIKVLRISSSLFPIWDHVDPTLVFNVETEALLEKIGTEVRKHKVRITTHPDQFIVLSSKNPAIISNSIKELNFHGTLFDRMGLDQTPYYSINIHGGARGQSERLIRSIDRLEIGVRSRLTLENCEFAYSVKELEVVSRKTGVPVCYDSHHHEFRTDGLTSKEAMELAISTWPSNVRPMTHLSNSKFPNDKPYKRRRHSDLITNIPQHQIDANNNGIIDIDVEAKLKNEAIKGCVQLGAIL
jgi:UV DNA damage endonuclease